MQMGLCNVVVILGNDFVTLPIIVEEASVQSTMFKLVDETLVELIEINGIYVVRSFDPTSSIMDRLAGSIQDCSRNYLVNDIVGSPRVLRQQRIQEK